MKIGAITRVEFSKNNTNRLTVFTGNYIEQANEIQWIDRRNENVSTVYNSELLINNKKLENLLDLCKT